MAVKDAMGPAPGGAAGGLRTTVLVLASIEAVLLGGLALLFWGRSLSYDPLGQSIGQAVALLLAIPLVFCSIPALVLGIVRRQLRLALGLVVLAVPVTAAIYLFM